MEITDIILESHIASEGEFTEEQLKEIEKLLENSTEVNLEQIVEVLTKGGHKVFQKHGHSMQITNFKSEEINEESEDFLNSFSELINKFSDQSIQQPNTKKI